ncbi:MAG: hypothetical protein QW756_08160 [Nitrososphaerota archaeon]
MLRRIQQYLRSVGPRNFGLALTLQLGLATFLAHGYDFRVSYVAGRNVASGTSPYVGGVLEGSLSLGYGPTVQGMGETPFWAIYTGFAYFLSGGEVFLFNLVSKTPVVLANILLSYMAYLRGCDGRFFLLNPYVLLVTASWGKPDNIATLLAILPLLYMPSWPTASMAASASLMVKPIGIPLLPSYVGYHRHHQVTAFLAGLALLSSLFFFTPFIVLGWPLATVVEGLPNWFKPAGGLSPFNIVEILTGSLSMPDPYTLLGLLAPTSTLVLTVIGYLFPPNHGGQALRLALLSSLTFFSLRPWISEQNLYLIMTLLILLNRRMSSRLLWVIPILFSAANLSLPQQIYLLRPTVIDELHAIDHVVRLWVRFGLSVAWLALVWKTAMSRGLLGWRN